MKRLAAYVGLNAVVWTGYHYINVIPEKYVDRFVAAEIVAVSVLGVGITLVWTKKYRPLSLGLLGILVGLGMIYFIIAGDGTFLAIREMPPKRGVTTTPRWYLELARTFLATGSAYAGYSLVKWAREHQREAFPWFRNHRADDNDPVDNMRNEED